MPSVTVAISTWSGHKDYLWTSVPSALDADQVLIIDNGHDCADVGRHFSEAHAHVSYHGRDETCLCDSRNLGLELSECDYLIHLDADDQMLCIPQLEGDWCVPRLLPLINDHGSIVGCWDYRFNPTNLEEAIEFSRRHLSLPTPMKAAFRTEWLRSTGVCWSEFPHTPYAEDTKTCFEYLKRYPRITYTDAFYAYRVRDGMTLEEKAEQSVFRRDLTEYLDSL